MGGGSQDPPGNATLLIMTLRSVFITLSYFPGKVAPQHLPGSLHVHGGAPELGHLLQVSGAHNGDLRDICVYTILNMFNVSGSF